MRPPSEAAMLLGHPIVTTPALLGYLAVIVRAFFDPGLWPLVLILLLVMGPIAHAKAQRDRYRAWQREWDSMAEPPRRQQ